MMNQQELDEQRFQSWLERLEKSLQDLDKAAWVLSPVDRAALLDTIKTTTIFDKESVPSWALRNERILSCLSSTSEELKSRLRRLTLPKLFSSFEQLKPQSGIEASLINVATHPLKREKNQDYEIIGNFFENLDKNPTDVVVGMCKLADYGSRFTYLKETDETYLAKLVQYETRRQATSDKEITVRTENLKYLERKDEENLISSSLVNFQEHLGQLRNDLASAEAEEEAARKIYDAAMLKAKKAKESMEKFETFVDVIGTQSEVLSKVNMIKIQLDTFNKASAGNRLNMLGSLQEAFSSIQSRVMEQRMNQEFPILLQNLNEIFRNMIASVAYSEQPNSELTTELSEQPVSIYCAVRIGLETINLWRRLIDVSHVQSIVESHLQEFSQFLEKVAQRLPDAPASGIDISNQFVDCTVVLHYTHICHETPGSHIENQLRTDACIKLLAKKVHSQGRNHNLLQGGNGGGSSGSTRQLILEKCNDILSPPLWCMPLVHGPQYLTQLWKFSEEAAEDDLYVPLEFETEWETDDEGLDEDVDERTLLDSLWKKRKNASHASLCASIEVDEAAKQKLGENKAHKLEQVLTPRFGDALIARALKKSTSSTQKVSTSSHLNEANGGNVHIVRKVKLEKEESDDESNGDNEEEDRDGPEGRGKPSKSSSGSSKTGKRVRTPFGPGTLLDPLDPEEERKPGRIVRVSLDWGAIGYLNTSVVHRSRRPRSMQPREPNKQKQLSSSAQNPSAAEDKSNKDRFLHTNFTLHRIVRKILAQVKVQRLILDRCGVKDAHLSLWIHGRTSKGITQNIENGMLNWLSKYDREELEQFLDEREKFMKQVAAEVFSSDLEIGTRFMKALDAIKKTDVYRPENIKNYLQDPSESREKLIEEGFAYSAQRLIKKSGEMRAKTVKTKRKSKHPNPPTTPGNTTNGGSSSYVNKDSGKGSAPVHRLLQLASTTPQVASIPVAASPTPTVAPSHRTKARSPRAREEPLFSEADGEQVRLILHKVNSFMNVSQTYFATELHRRFGVKTSQTTISAWTRNKASSISGRLLDSCVVKWIDHHKRLLSSVQLAQWEEIAERYRNDLDSQIIHATQQQDGHDDDDDDSNDESDDEGGIHMSQDHRSSSSHYNGPMDVAVEDEDIPVSSVPMEQDEPEQEKQEDGGGHDDNNEVIISSEDEQSDHTEESIPKNLIPVCHNEPQPKIEDPMEVDEMSNDEKVTVKKQQDIQSESEDLVSESEHEEDRLVGVVKSVAGYEDVRDPDFALLLKELKKVWSLFGDEQNRRSLTHSYISQESTRLGLKLPQPNISKFYREKVFPFVNRAREFLNQISRWIAYSRTKSVEKNNQSQHICSGCGVHRVKFQTQKDFLNHIGTCPAKNDVVPLEATIDKYTSTGKLFVCEFSEEQAAIESQIKKFVENPESSLRKSSYNKSCYICSRDDDVKICSACKKCYHPCCVTATGSSGGDNEFCTTCKHIIHVSHFHGSPNEITVGKFILAPNHLRGVLQDAVVLHKLSHNGHEVVLLKFLVPLDDSHSAVETEDVYQWLPVDMNAMFLLKAESESSWRKRAGRPSTSTPVTTRKRTADEMESGDDDEDGREEEAHENPYVRRTRPRRVVEEPIGPRAKRSTAGRGGRGQQQQPQPQQPAAPEPKNGKSTDGTAEEMTDTYLSANSLKAALCAAGSACRAVDIVMTNRGSNVFVCTRPPGHHAGRYGLTRGCLGTGFCLLNNAAIALTYARIRWGLERIAIVDIDVHFGNGTADILKGDKEAFFASVHMIYGQKNDGVLTEQQSTSTATLPSNFKYGRKDCVCGFFPSELGETSITDNFISVGVFPEHLDKVKNRRQRRRRRRTANAEYEDDDEEEEIEVLEVQKQKSFTQMPDSGNNYVGSKGFLKALKEVVIPRMERYKPQLLIISAGFDGFLSDPLGGEMGLTLDDFTFCTNLLTSSMSNIAKTSGDPRSGRVISLLEGGYDTSVETQGLAKCVDAHVAALRTK